MTTEYAKRFISSTGSEESKIKDPIKKKKYIILSSTPDDPFEAEFARTKAMLEADKMNATFIRNRLAIDAEDLENAEILTLDLDLICRYKNAV